MLSDCMYYCEGCLASNLYHLINGGLLKKYCFIKLLNPTYTLIGKTIVVDIHDLVAINLVSWVDLHVTILSLDVESRKTYQQQPPLYLASEHHINTVLRLPRMPHLLLVQPHL